ncbi:MAG: hypothetical protein NZO58_07555, partial [Gemmataceae bacterium]|nr:hypothetical protein [Gemmataceae bacterium]
MVRRSLMALAVALLALTPLYADTKVGTPPLKSIEALAFGPEGLLILGDGKGAQIVTVETGDTTPREWKVTEIPDLTSQLAGRLGTTSKGIKITKLAINPASRVAYLAVRKLDGKQDVILTISPDGKIGEFALTKVKYTVYPLPAEKSPVTLITDLTYVDRRILIAAQANEIFASKIYVIDLRSEEPQAAYVSTETYHVAHGKWETKAPIRTVIPYEEGGKRYLVGAFTCTPIVKYSLDDVKIGGKVKGTSVIELGYGNDPVDMFAYEKDGKHYILVGAVRRDFANKKDPVGPSPYWAAKVDYTILQENEQVNEKALVRTA